MTFQIKGILNQFCNIWKNSLLFGLDNKKQSKSNNLKSCLFEA